MARVRAPQLLLVGMAAGLVEFVASSLVSAEATAEFATDLLQLDPIAAAEATFTTTFAIFAAVTAFLLVELFSSVHACGWEQARSKYGGRKA